MYNDRLNGLVTGHKTLVEYILWLFYVQWVWRNVHELIMFLLLLPLFGAECGQGGQREEMTSRVKRREEARKSTP